MPHPWFLAAVVLQLNPVFILIPLGVVLITAYTVWVFLYLPTYIPLALHASTRLRLSTWTLLKSALECPSGGARGRHAHPPFGAAEVFLAGAPETAPPLPWGPPTLARFPGPGGCLPPQESLLFRPLRPAVLSFFILLTGTSLICILVP